MIYKIATVQIMQGYSLVVSLNGTIYYRVDSEPNILFDSGEAVPPDEHYGYEFQPVEAITLPFSEIPLYTDIQIN